MLGDCGGGASRLAVQEGLSKDPGTARVNHILAAPVGGTFGEPFEEALLPWPQDVEC